MNTLVCNRGAHLRAGAYPAVRRDLPAFGDGDFPAVLPRPGKRQHRHRHLAKGFDRHHYRRGDRGDGEKRSSRQKGQAAGYLLALNLCGSFPSVLSADYSFSRGTCRIGRSRAFFAAE